MFVGTLLSVSLLLGAVKGSILLRQNAERQKVRPCNGMSQEAMARSQEIVGVLMAGAGGADMEITRTTLYSASGRAMPTWTVECSDRTSGKNARLLWSAEGELLRANQWRDRDVPPPAAPSHRRAAIGLTWDWFRALKLSHEHESWHVQAARKVYCAQWEVDLQSEDRTAFFLVNTATGKMVQMVCTHRTEMFIARNEARTKAAF